MKICSYNKNANMMAFLMSINANKYVCLALDVDCTARDVMKAKFTRISSIIPHYIVLVLPNSHS